MWDRGWPPVMGCYSDLSRKQVEVIFVALAFLVCVATTGWFCWFCVLAAFIFTVSLVSNYNPNRICWALIRGWNQWAYPQQSTAVNIVPFRGMAAPSNIYMMKSLCLKYFGLVLVLLVLARPQQRIPELISHPTGLAHTNTHQWTILVLLHCHVDWNLLLARNMQNNAARISKIWILARDWKFPISTPCAEQHGAWGIISVNMT